MNSIKLYYKMDTIFIDNKTSDTQSFRKNKLKIKW